MQSVFLSFIDEQTDIASLSRILTSQADVRLPVGTLIALHPSSLELTDSFGNTLHIKELPNLDKKHGVKLFDIQFKDIYFLNTVLGVIANVPFAEIHTDYGQLCSGDDFAQQVIRNPRWDWRLVSSANAE